MPLRFLLGAMLAGATESREIDRPNIVHVMADEWGYYELSSLGHPNLKTPRIDRMAAEGLRFTQMLAGSSLCAPTRACLMTGKHSGHTSVRSNGGGTPLRAGEPTIASVLRSRGYATGGFGKWGCGGRGSTGVPEEHGFDVFFGYYDQVHAHTYYPPYLIRNSTEVALAGNRGGREGETYSHHVIFQAGLEFLREYAERPFYLYLPVTPPHGLFDIPDDDPSYAVFANENWPEEARRYAAMVHLLDRNVGELLDLLDELGLSERTLVILSGDNGGVNYFRSEEHPRGFHAPNVDPRTGTEFRGQKGNLYEGGLRIPAIARWPGTIAAGGESDHLGYFPDFLPTFAELAGASAPDDVDGRSFVPTLLGPETAGREQEQAPYLYWELGGQVAVRAGHWKAVRPGKDRPFELYDLARDPSEQNDLAAGQPDRLAQLIQFASEAHEPVVEGVFHDRTLHEKDRAAKWGDAPRPSPPVHALDPKGLLDHRRFTVLRASSESAFNGRLAKNAIDGDPRTIWHTRWQEDLAQPPHELVIDLGARATLRGFRYLARQDQGFNGTIHRCDFTISDDAQDFGAPGASAEFRKVKTGQQADCEPMTGRYLRVRIHTEVQNGPWASIAELGVIGEFTDE